MHSTPRIGARRSPALRPLAITVTVVALLAACGDGDTQEAIGGGDTSAETGSTWTTQPPDTDGDPPPFMVLERGDDEVRLPTVLVQHPSTDDERLDCAARGALRRDTARDDLVDVDLDSLTIEAYGCFTTEALAAQLVDELERDEVPDEQVACVTDALATASAEEWATALVWDHDGVVFEPCGIDR
ncbi:MAG: hypothetical protein JJU45_02265 [Acidimicrobiia bacterium]|nr:hypothetical protein [Acidimicrobiia bacterium]